MNYTILIADDEPEIRTLLRLYLENENYQIIEAENGKQALELLKKEHVDLCLLDIMMPEMDGYHVLQELRKTSNIPVMILSAKDADSEKILGLNLGADDYLAKPFSLPELKMRIYAIIRRKKFYTSNILCSNGIKIDLLKKTVTINSETITLTRTEYELLLFLISNKNKVISKLSMAEHLTGEMADMLDNHNFVYTHIKNLKAKLTRQGCSECIKNIYGTGYKWIEE